MILLNSFTLINQREEERFIHNITRTCYDSYYPYGLFPQIKMLENLHFSDITILCGSNGSGKSTLLNIIAEKLQLRRETSFNKSPFFDSYIEKCSYNLREYAPMEFRNIMSNSRIITSDDVFNHILSVRKRNEALNFKREIIFEEKRQINQNGWQGPRGFSADDPESIKAYTDYYKKSRYSASRYVRENVGVDERTYSNGENGFKYFTDAIQPGGLYLLDEPENSLSAEMQLELVQFILSMARYYNCQFILSTHSPFLLSIPFARIYDMDSEPVTTCKWTELPSVRIFYDFFKDHENEFE